MGLLDDAIREHLDLKRRRGGDPAEIAQAERDALGPVRREREPAAEDGEAFDLVDEQERTEPDEPLATPATRLAMDSEIDWDDPADHAADAAVAPPPVGASERFEGRAPAGAGDETVEYRVGERFDDEPAEEQEPEAPGAVSRLRSRFGRQPASPPAEPEAPAPDPNDVLEETPDFLQDTPDHDRLWFEQKPPRDFDFDG